MKLGLDLGIIDARNLRKGAQYVVENFGGVMPLNGKKSCKKVPVSGVTRQVQLLPSRLEKQAPLVDGNVVRFFARLLDCR